MVLRFTCTQLMAPALEELNFLIGEEQRKQNLKMKISEKNDYLRVLRCFITMLFYSYCDV